MLDVTIPFLKWHCGSRKKYLMCVHHEAILSRLRALHATLRCSKNSLGGGSLHTHCPPHVHSLLHLLKHTCLLQLNKPLLDRVYCFPSSCVRCFIQSKWINTKLLDFSLLEAAGWTTQGTRMWKWMGCSSSAIGPRCNFLLPWWSPPSKLLDEAWMPLLARCVCAKRTQECVEVYC